VARRLVGVAAALLLHGSASAQAADSSRTTRAGVYTARQAAGGHDIYMLSCVSCHTPASHSGTGFAAKWSGRPLSELFGFMRGAMPKNEPGSLSAREYTLVLAYLLKMNGMPAGPAELPADSVALSRIRIELKASGDTSQAR
jgi:mono/diheme cytochrome c family protein